jgi:heptosyltransferase II
VTAPFLQTSRRPPRLPPLPHTRSNPAASISPGTPAAAPAKPPRVLMFMPSWLGDTVMATPTLRLLRQHLPQSTIVALVRPGIDDLLAGLDWLDDVLVADRTALLGPAKTASRLMAFKFDAALLLPNSFSSAMTTRLAGVPIRLGYDRDGRGMLLTHRLSAKERPAPQKGWAPVSAVNYYYDAGLSLLAALGIPVAPDATSPGLLELALTPAQQEAGDRVLLSAGVQPETRYCILNPGGNNPAKRWPVERFAALAHHLITVHKLRVLINGSPGEAPLAALIKHVIALNHPEDEAMVACLPELGIKIGSLKRIVQRSCLMVTNDTGPRHIAAAFGIPCIAMFGPTDHRWTTLPLRPDSQAERVLLSDPDLPDDLVADEHPDRCRIDRITTEQVFAAVDAELTRQSPAPR